MSNIDVLARTLYGESRGEGTIGLTAVACVVMNRVAQPNHQHFGNGDITACCKAPYQFSCWNENDPNLPKLLAVTDADPIFAQCLTIAAKAIAGQLSDPTGGGTYYEVEGTDAAWSKGHIPCAVIGQHIFYKDIA